MFCSLSLFFFNLWCVKEAYKQDRLGVKLIEYLRTCNTKLVKYYCTYTNAPIATITTVTTYIVKISLTSIDRQNKKKTR